MLNWPKNYQNWPAFVTIKNASCAVCLGVVACDGGGRITTINPVARQLPARNPGDRYPLDADPLGVIVAAAGGRTHRKPTSLLLTVPRFFSPCAVNRYRPVKVPLQPLWLTAPVNERLIRRYSVRNVCRPSARWQLASPMKYATHSMALPVLLDSGSRSWPGPPGVLGSPQSDCYRGPRSRANGSGPARPTPVRQHPAWCRFPRPRRPSSGRRCPRTGQSPTPTRGS